MVVDARDAMDGEGELTIRGDHAAMPGADGDAVAVTVTDTESGIPVERLGRTFAPFYITKGVGKGTGLRLSQVYGFAQAVGRRGARRQRDRARDRIHALPAAGRAATADDRGSVCAAGVEADPGTPPAGRGCGRARRAAPPTLFSRGTVAHHRASVATACAQLTILARVTEHPGVTAR